MCVYKRGVNLSVLQSGRSQNRLTWEAVILKLKKWILKRVWVSRAKTEHSKQGNMDRGWKIDFNTQASVTSMNRGVKCNPVWQHCWLAEAAARVRNIATNNTWKREVIKCDRPTCHKEAVKMLSVAKRSQILEG